MTQIKGLACSQEKLPREKMVGESYNNYNYNISDICRKYFCLYDNTNVEVIDLKTKNERRRSML